MGIKLTCLLDKGRQQRQISDAEGKCWINARCKVQGENCARCKVKGARSKKCKVKKVRGEKSASSNSASSNSARCKVQGARCKVKNCARCKVVRCRGKVDLHLRGQLYISWEYTPIVLSYYTTWWAMMPPGTVCAHEMRLGKFLGCVAPTWLVKSIFSASKISQHVINEQRTNLAPDF